jgi:CubicO group peptidase (beta-lactamase class C family)
MTVRRFAAALAALLLLTSGASSAQQSFNRFELFSVLDTYLEALRQQAGIPGMSAAVVKDGVILWERGYGFQDLTARIRATPDTPYMAGDVSATLAAVLLLQCVEQRRLELDAPVSGYGVSFPDGEVTLRELLSHTSTEGFVGTFQYNPERYTQLTTVMEHCAPQSYRKSVAHRLLNRLAMKDSVPGTDLLDPDFELPEDLFEEGDAERYRRVLARMAVPYKVDNRGRADRIQLTPTTLTTAGGLVTTVRDLAQLQFALDSYLLLQEETVAAAWTNATNRRGGPVPMGLGWFVQFHRGQRVVWHFGYTPNAYSSLVVKVPAHNLTFILMANSDRLSAPFQLPQGDVTRSVFATLFLRLFT